MMTVEREQMLADYTGMVLERDETGVLRGDYDLSLSDTFSKKQIPITVNFNITLVDYCKGTYKDMAIISIAGDLVIVFCLYDDSASCDLLDVKDLGGCEWLFSSPIEELGIMAYDKLIKRFSRGNFTIVDGRDNWIENVRKR